MKELHLSKESRPVKQQEFERLFEAEHSFEYTLTVCRRTHSRYYERIDVEKIPSNEEQRFFEEEFKTAFWKIVSEACNENELKILKLRYINCKSLAQIKEVLGLSRERIRQIEARAICKIQRQKIEELRLLQEDV